MKMLLGVPSVRMSGQEQVYQTTHVMQANTQSGSSQPQQPQNVHLVNLLKPHAGITVTPGAPGGHQTGLARRRHVNL